MLGPIVLDSELSRRIIAILEGPQVEIEALQTSLAELEAERGPEIYRHLFYILGHLDFRPREAKTHWQGARNAWARSPPDSNDPSTFVWPYSVICYREDTSSETRPWSRSTFCRKRKSSPLATS